MTKPTTEERRQAHIRVTALVARTGEILAEHKTLDAPDGFYSLPDAEAMAFRIAVLERKVKDGAMGNSEGSK